MKIVIYHDSKLVLSAKQQSEIAFNLLEKAGINTIHYSSLGKPYSDNVFFNISHNEHTVVIAYGDKEIGVDIQAIKPISKSLITRLYHPNEKSNDFKKNIRIWAIKESYVKCTGYGINSGLVQIDLSQGLVCDEFSYGDYQFRVKEHNDEVLSLCYMGEPENVEVIYEYLSD